MKAVQTFWSNLSLNAGWLKVKYHLFSCALSTLQLSKYFNEIELITDDIGYNILVEKLNLPYTSLLPILEELPPEFSELWVLKKIHSYSLQCEPFIHIDADVYFFDSLSIKFTSAPLLAQNYEYNHPYYIDPIKQVKEFPCLPQYLKDIDLNHVSAVNAGILGGSDTSFFKEFEKHIYSFLSSNQEELCKINTAYLNIFLEQYLFKQIADWKGIPITCLLKEKIGYPHKYGLDRFADLPKQCNYIHVMNYKQNPTVCEQLAQRLWLESPELYERVLTVCRELEATHHPVSSPPAPPVNLFYRTQYVLSTIQPLAVSATESNALLTQINALPNENAKSVLLDAFQYEQCRQAFVNALPDTVTLKQDWQRWSAKTNALLSLPVETYHQQLIQRSAYFHRIDSEWNWAEVNEFAGQDADRDFAHNLQVAPAYYETVLYVYLNQGVVREQLLDALNMLILDALEESATIASVIEAVSEQVLVYQPTLDKEELAKTILSRVRHFLYHGVLMVSDE